jgi:(E)-4-hydroxy-3-methyl-but-2-enyl pyrophosphate reductase
MKVIVAENCGFCPGVRNAIRTAEKILTQKKNVYSLGPIIHNSDVVRRLAKAGLKTVNSVKQIPSRRGPQNIRLGMPYGRGTVLIRSHGAAPKQIAELKEKTVIIIDATCILVKRVQRIAKQLNRAGYKVVVIGDENHPEVQAVVGSTAGVVVIGSESDLRKLPLNGKLGIVCQTTQSQEHFSKMLEAISRHGFSELKVINTLCREAIKRQESAVQLCRQVDIMFVLGGRMSANTRMLAKLCKKYNSRTFHLQNWNEFDRLKCFGKKGVLSRVAGVTAGASTPEWIIAEFVENLAKIE